MKSIFYANRVDPRAIINRPSFLPGDFRASAAEPRHAGLPHDPPAGGRLQLGHQQDGCRQPLSGMSSFAASSLCGRPTPLSIEHDKLVERW